MQRSQAIVQAVLRSPLLWGALASAGFYGAVDAGLVEHPLVARYLAGHWAAYICTSMFLVGVAAIVLKVFDLAGQFEVLRLTYFDPAPQGQPLSDCGLLLARLDKQPKRVHETYLFGRLRTAVEYLSRKGTTDTFEDELRTLTDLDVARKHASYGVLRMVIWAIPFVGSLGTVVGIGTAVANLSPEASDNLIAAVAPGLEMVFDTTALALALSVVLMLGMFACDQVESRLLLAVDARAGRELVGRFKGGATLKNIQSGGPTNLSDGFAGAIEKLMERQTEMWQASMEAANKQWEERAAMLKQELGAASAGGAVAFHAGGGGFAPSGLSGDNGPLQEALMRSANFAAAQQAELAIQNEVMQQLAEVIGAGSANRPVRRSRLFKSASAGEFEAQWADNS